MRGKQHLRRDSLGREGITPACAGKTGTHRGSGRPHEDHPRVCGENDETFGVYGWQRGSPPRVRGKPCGSGKSGRVRGITPACAGKTPLPCMSHIAFWDHPRVCGENSTISIGYPCNGGSPPRVRGKPCCRSSKRLFSGITPACAGKTRRCTPAKRLNRDHPRVCGENMRAGLHLIGGMGSPPRVRGKQRHSAALCPLSGITPACAGKTRAPSCTPVCAGDHPRVCGENVSNRLLRRFRRGSPPRVRGKHPIRAAHVKHPGITPACAGKTLRKWRISVIDPSPQPRSSLTSRRADASIGSQRAPCAAPV